MGSLTKPLILVVVIYLLLKFVVPNIPGSAPLPSSLIFLYLMLTVAGIVIYYTMSGESKDASTRRAASRGRSSSRLAPSSSAR